jgi:hypothetical protein
VGVEENHPHRKGLLVQSDRVAYQLSMRMHVHSLDQTLVSSKFSGRLNLMNGVSDCASLDNDFYAGSIMSRRYLPVASDYIWATRRPSIKISFPWTIAAQKLHAHRLGRHVSIL